MDIEQRQWTSEKNWNCESTKLAGSADLVLVFGQTNALKNELRIHEIQQTYPGAHVVGCSTAGEIQGTQVFDNTICTTAIKFTNTEVKTASSHFSESLSCYQAGQELAGKIPHENLIHVLVFSVGIDVNGSELVKGLNSVLPPTVTMTGGLAGDQQKFSETVVICNSKATNDLVAVIGLYGQQLKIGTASLGGWDPFGPKRKVTKATGNVLYELDGKSALDLYKKYLGDHQRDLPGSALLFPLSMRLEGSPYQVVRTVLSVDEKKQTMTFAGDLIEGAEVQLMKANFDRLIDGAIDAADISRKPMASGGGELALLISCVGRKTVLKQRVEEEIEGVREIFGDDTVLTGFYSYGEISPFMTNGRCELHNQTMTITTLEEFREPAP